MEGITVEELVGNVDAQLGIRVHAGRAGLARTIEVPRIQKPGLALTGYREQLHDRRLLVLGGTEIEYLAATSGDARTLAVATVMDSNPAAIVVTRGLVPPDELVAACEAADTALLVTELISADFITRVTTHLDQALAPSTSVHGVLVDVLELGILLLGKSGIGKSESALDLIVRGHRLVADDVVRLTELRGEVTGSKHPTLGHNMEIRGLGIINIADLYGITAIRDHKTVDLVVELVMWDEDAEYDRLGIDTRTYSILGQEIPFIEVPVRPGRHVATIIEVAARNQLLRDIGTYSARDFLGRLEGSLSRARSEVDS